jgi:hypothetical protein
MSSTPPARRCIRCGEPAFFSSEHCYACMQLGQFDGNGLFGGQSSYRRVTLVSSTGGRIVQAVYFCAVILPNLPGYGLGLFRYSWFRDAVTTGLIVVALIWSGRSYEVRDALPRLNAPPVDEPPTRQRRFHAFLAGPVMQHSLYAGFFPYAVRVFGGAMRTFWTPPSAPMSIFGAALVAFNAIAAFGARVDDEDREPLARRWYTAGVTGLWLASAVATLWLGIDALRHPDPRPF